jgi:5'(3')-deoxyribonucleotidase
MKDLKIYVDMDGVIADFNAEHKAVERFKVEKGFFYRLKPISVNAEAVKVLISKGYDVSILTTSPHDRADKDKMRWLKKHLPQVKKVIFARPERAKIDYIEPSERAKALLFDDYGRNIKEWLHGGGMKAVKVEPSYTIFDELVKGL